MGYDAGKKVKGRKRHLAVDSLGLPVAAVVTGAHVQDSEPAAAAELMVRLRQAADRARERLGRWPRLRALYADGNYRGTADMWAKRLGFALVRVEREGRGAGPRGGGRGRGFQRLPKRWVVERTFAWLFNYRRLLFDLEYKTANSEGMIWVAAAHRMLNRIWPKETS